MVLYQIFYIRSNKISLKDFDIKHTKSSTFIVNQTFEEAKNVIETIIPKTINYNKIKYDLKEELFITKTSLNIYSWGETIEIKITQSENIKTQISILSKPVLMTNLFDFGKSSMNIDKIKLAFDKNGL